MTKEEAIQILEVAKAEIEWEYPMDYQVALDMAIEALQNQIKDEDNPCTTCDASHCDNCLYNGRIID